MRWDYGQVYKKIRQSKGLTQQDVCGDMLHRSTLANIEKGKLSPVLKIWYFCWSKLI